MKKKLILPCLSICPEPSVPFVQVGLLSRSTEIITKFLQVLCLGLSDLLRES